jgi:hypothetical protein|nr:MAG TPA: hypothetical protein [Caudoviricetes sp.]DAT71570.1 MAG TPA: hypothetical protein [Caudoviricetes sp.]
MEKNKTSIKAFLISAEKIKEMKEENEKDEILTFEFERMKDIIGTKTLKFRRVKKSSFYDMVNEEDVQKRNAILFSKSLIQEEGKEIFTEEAREAFGVKTNWELAREIFTDDEMNAVTVTILSRIGNGVRLVDDIKN